jgi:hypothetical protein
MCSKPAFSYSITLHCADMFPCSHQQYSTLLSQNVECCIKDTRGLVAVVVVICSSSIAIRAVIVFRTWLAVVVVANPVEFLIFTRAFIYCNLFLTPRLYE